MQKLTTKIQILLDEEDANELNMLLLRVCLEKGRKVVSLSSFVRDMIKDYIEIEKQRKPTEQISFAEGAAKKVMNDYYKKKGVKNKK
jgi:hypothetical protein